MRNIAPLFVISCLRLTAAEPVSKVAFSESRHAIRAFSPSGEVTVPVIRTQLEIRYPGGRIERGDLVVVRDATTERYFWRYTRLRDAGDRTSFLSGLESGTEAVFTSPDQIVDFYIPGELYVQEHRERADTLDAAEDAAIREIGRGLPDFEKTGYHTEAKGIAVIQAIEKGFDCPAPPVSSICASVTKITSITRQDTNWQLVVQNQWDEEVILDPNLSLVRTKRLSNTPNGKHQE